MNNRVRVRYAPSPTGYLHIGNARTAMFNYLFAKHYHGDFILRIEDTDIERNVEGGEESQNVYLDWLGIIPDESPQKPNHKYAPYRQMERLDIYQKYADELLAKGFAYKCFCTTEELEIDYQKQKDAGYASTRYNRKCCDLTSEEVAAKEAEGLLYTIRIKVPDNETYAFNDMIRGLVSFESKDIGDWVLVKANGIPTYNFAVVIDDHTMDITHVFRGEEHLSNTPKQMMIYKILGWDIPVFAHMTLIVNEDHKKLSKRDNHVLQFMSQYKELGYLPEAMFNFLALLGWSSSNDQEIFTKDELIAEFSEKRLSKAPSMFDKSKLAWVNNRYIKALPFADYALLVKPFLAKTYDLSQKNEAWINELISIYQEQISYGAEIIELTKEFFEVPELNDEAKEVLAWETTEVVKKAFLKQINSISEWNIENIKGALNNTKEMTGIKGKALFMGLRVVVSYQMHGPDFTNLVHLLGRDIIMKRLAK